MTDARLDISVGVEPDDEIDENWPQIIEEDEPPPLPRFDFEFYDAGLRRSWYLLVPDDDEDHWEGAWSASTNYQAKACVTSGSGVYECLVEHTASDDNKPGVGPKWTQFWSRIWDGTVNDRGAWDCFTNYDVMDLVHGRTLDDMGSTTGGGLAVCIRPIDRMTLAERFPPEKWVRAHSTADSSLYVRNIMNDPPVDGNVFGNDPGDVRRAEKNWVLRREDDGAGGHNDTPIWGEYLNEKATLNAVWYDLRHPLPRRFLPFDVVEVYVPSRLRDVYLCIAEDVQEGIEYPYGLQNEYGQKDSDPGHEWRPVPCLESQNVSKLGELEYETGDPASQNWAVLWGIRHVKIKHVFLANSFLPDPNELEQEYGDANPYRWYRKPIGAVGGVSTASERRHIVSSDDYVIRLQMKPVSDGATEVEPKVDLTPDLKAAEEDKGNYKLLDQETVSNQETTRRYRSRTGVRPPKYLCVTEEGTAAGAIHVKVDGVDAANTTIRNSWISPKGLFFSGFDLSDHDTYKVTREARFDAEEVDHDILKGVRVQTKVQVFLMPRRWAYYGFVSFLTSNADDLNIETGQHWYWETKDCPAPTRQTTWPYGYVGDITDEWHQLYEQVRSKIPLGNIINCSATLHPDSDYGTTDQYGNQVTHGPFPKWDSGHGYLQEGQGDEPYWYGPEHELDKVWFLNPPFQSLIDVSQTIMASDRYVFGGGSRGYGGGFLVNDALVTYDLSHLNFPVFLCWYSGHSGDPDECGSYRRPWSQKIGMGFKTLRNGFVLVHGVNWARAPSPSLTGYRGRLGYETAPYRLEYRMSVGPADKGVLGCRDATPGFSCSRSETWSDTVPVRYDPPLVDAREWERIAQGWDQETAEIKIVSGLNDMVVYAEPQAGGTYIDYQSGTAEDPLFFFDDRHYISSGVSEYKTPDPFEEKKAGLWLDDYLPGAPYLSAVSSNVLLGDNWNSYMRNRNGSVGISPDKTGQLVGIVRVGSTAYFIWRRIDEEFSVFGTTDGHDTNWKGTHVGFVPNNCGHTPLYADLLNYGTATPDIHERYDRPTNLLMPWFVCDQGWGSGEWAITHVGVIPQMEYVTQADDLCHYCADGAICWEYDMLDANIVNDLEAGHEIALPYYACHNCGGHEHCLTSGDPAHSQALINVVRGSSGQFPLERPIYVMGRKWLRAKGHLREY